MKKSRKLQIKILLFIVKLIGGIHLRDEYRDEIKALTAAVDECND